MKMVFLVCLSVFLTACSIVEYKEADLSQYGGLDGYLDRELSPGVHVIEVQQMGGYVRDIEVLKSYWVRRSQELCPNGYAGDYELVKPINAKIKEFSCDLRFCQQYLMVSGVITCQTDD